MGAESNEIVTFGPFRLSPAEGVLRRGDRIVPLTPKAFDLLALLAASVGKVVSKEEIMRSVWPDAFVEEGTLSQNIFTLRKTLGPRPDGGQFIETIPKRGYRLSAPPAETEPVAGPARTRSIFPVKVAIACFGLLVALTVAAARWAPTGERPPQVKITTLTVPNELTYAVISPDARAIAYVSYERGIESLWVRAIGDLGAGRRLAGPLGGAFWGVSFSPDGRYLYYSSEENAHPVWGRLYRVSTSGGEPSELLTRIAGPPQVSPDGGRLVFKRYYTNAPAELWTAASDGSNPRRIATSGAAHAFYGFQWAADGTRIYYSEGSQSESGSRWNLFELAAGGGPARVLFGPLAEPLRSVTWLNRSEAMALRLDPASGRSQIWRLRASEAPLRLTNDTADYTMLSVTADGRELLANSTETEDAIWVDAAPGVGPSEAVRLALPPGSYNDPAWLPDGRLVFVNQSNLWVAAADGSGRRPLLAKQGPVLQPAASPDGTFLVFTRWANGWRDIWRVSLDGTGLRRVTMGEYAFDPVVSPDGQWVVYASNLLGKRTLRRVAADGAGIPQQLTESGCEGKSLSPDGTSIACVNDDGRIEIRRLADGSIERRLQSPPYPDGVRWSADGTQVFFVSGDNGSKQFWSESAEGSEPRPMGRTLPDDFRAPAWSQSRLRIVYLRRQTKVDLSLITDFR